MELNTNLPASLGDGLDITVFLERFVAVGRAVFTPVLLVVTEVDFAAMARVTRRSVRGCGAETNPVLDVACLALTADPGRGPGAPVVAEPGRGPGATVPVVTGAPDFP